MENQTTSTGVVPQSDQKSFVQIMVEGFLTGDPVATKIILLYVVIPLSMGLLVGTYQKSVVKGLLALIATFWFDAYVVPEINLYNEEINYNNSNHSVL